MDAMPRIGLDALVMTLLGAGGPDRALDAVIHVLREADPVAALSGGVCPEVAALIALMEDPPAYTADPARVRAAARARGMVAATGTGAGGCWASVWLPPPRGDAPVLMFAPDEARAACAAFAEGVRLMVTGAP